MPVCTEAVQTLRLLVFGGTQPRAPCVGAHGEVLAGTHTLSGRGSKGPSLESL